MTDYSEQELLVLGMLRHRRRANALGMPQLAACVGCSSRRVQQLVKGLIEYHAEPIGSLSASGQHGYFWIEEPEDLDKAEANLRHRALSVLRRLAKLKRATPAEVLGQLQLELDATTEAA